jgi:hypothetical protein
MDQISPPEAESLISKLLTERTPVRVHLKSASGTETDITGFIDTKTIKGGIVISTSGSPLKPELGFLTVRPFDSVYEIWYGEKRELPDDLKRLADKFGESALVFCSAPL